MREESIVSSTYEGHEKTASSQGEAAQKMSANQALRKTFAALRPFGPCWHSNSTASPSFNVL